MIPSPGRCVAVSFFVYALLLTLPFAPQADARITALAQDDPLLDSKHPYSNVYEVRGEGFVHNVGNLWVNVTNL